MPPGFRPAAASTQRQHGGAGWLVRASAHGPIKETADGGRPCEEDQGAGDGPEDQAGAPEGRDAETGGAASLSGAEAQSDGKGEGGESHRIRGTVTTAC